MPPFFSVVIPTYNCAKFLKRALTSVFSQTYQNFEVIVVDNSSTDNTENVIKSFAENRMNVIEVNNNGIIAYSRNKGIKNAKGDWIAFLDSDDVWKPNKLEKVRDVIDHNSEVILVCHDEWHVHKGKIKNRLKYGPAGPDMYDRLIFKGNCISTSAVCLRKDIAIKSGGFSERKAFVTVEDYEYWIRLTQEGKFYFINEVLGEWHTHGKNYSDDAIIHAGALIAVMEHHLDRWLKTFPGSIKRVKQGRATVYTQAGRILQKRGLFPNAYRYAWNAILKSPFRVKAWMILLLSFFRINYPR
ncbi:MAG: glycosyltransferase [Candidatus Marinimicrobia bacterium]|nr:glycosyltransferase [Candidatus Neomarinimicrobiota bacterium]